MSTLGTRGVGRAERHVLFMGYEITVNVVTFWHLDWDDPSPGEHDITSRAIDAEGHVQPAPTHPLIANKHTYWESNQQVTRRVRIS